MSRLLLALAAIAGTLAACRGGDHGRPVAAGTPIPSAIHEGLVAFVKHETCEPTTCDAVVCQTFSDGQTKNLPAHLVRCRWSDRRAPAGASKCAYAHYAVEPAGAGMSSLFLSAPSLGDTCQPDEAFKDRIRGLGYSGALP